MSLCYCLTCFYAPDSILKMKVWVSCSFVSDSLWPHGLWPGWLLCPWTFPGKNTGVGSHSLPQGTFLTQGLNTGPLHCRQILYHLSHQGSHITYTLMVTSGDLIRSRSVFYCFHSMISLCMEMNKLILLLFCLCFWILFPLLKFYFHEVTFQDYHNWCCIPETNAEPGAGLVFNNYSIKHKLVFAVLVWWEILSAQGFELVHLCIHTV